MKEQLSLHAFNALENEAWTATVSIVDNPVWDAIEDSITRPTVEQVHEES